MKAKMKNSGKDERVACPKGVVKKTRKVGLHQKLGSKNWEACLEQCMDATQIHRGHIEGQIPQRNIPWYAKSLKGDGQVTASRAPGDVNQNAQSLSSKFKRNAKRNATPRGRRDPPV